MRTCARCRVALGLRPFPRSESLRTLIQANLARPRRFVKCWWVERLSCSQKPSHLTDGEGWIISPLREIGERQRGDLSFGERQCMRSVLLMEKERLSDLALLEITLNMR